MSVTNKRTFFPHFPAQNSLEWFLHEDKRCKKCLKDYPVKNAKNYAVPASERVPWERACGCLNGRNLCLEITALHDYSVTKRHDRDDSSSLKQIWPK